MTISFQEELHRRGMAKDVSDAAGLSQHLASGQRRAYVGFDPTSTSLTVGNLLPIMLLRAFQRHGHRPVVLAGGGTGLIGDPSGKSLERPLLEPSDVEANLNFQRPIFEKLLDFDGNASAEILNNLAWLGELSLLPTLRDIGKHLSIFSMFAKDVVRTRQAEGGFMSFAEFSYQLLQAYDFYFMFANHGVTIQMGGSDQWGNITTGIDLIQKMHSEYRVEAYGLTAPLLTDTRGVKMGKSELGAVYLTADKTSPYLLYQYFVNLSDEFAAMILPWMVDIPLATVTDALHEAGDDRSSRLVQVMLADHVVGLLHGEGVAQLARDASRSLFEKGVRAMSREELLLAFAHVPSLVIETSPEAIASIDLQQILVDLGVTPSRKRARALLEDGGVTLNGEAMGIDTRLTPTDLLYNEFAVVRRGTKTWFVVRFEGLG